MVLDLKMSQDTSHTLVLLEWRRGIPVCFQGPKVQLTDDIEARLIQLRGSEVSQEGSSQEGSSHTIPVHETPMSTTSVTLGAEFFPALGNFITKCNQTNVIHSGASYRKPKLFSGAQPVPKGEEENETWMEHALEEWDVPEAQKKQRITESIRGAAAEALRNLMFSRKTCTAYDLSYLVERRVWSNRKGF